MTTLPYNLTAYENVTGPLALMQAANGLSGGVLGNGLYIVFGFIIFGLSMAVMRYSTGQTDMKKALIATGWLCFVFGILLLAAEFVNVWLVIMYLVLGLVGVAMSQKEDYGT